MKKLTFASLAAIGLPLVALAQPGSIGGVINDLGVWVNTLTGIVAAVALLVFFWGVVRYIAAAGDEKAKDQGKRIMTGGVIALFVLFSIFGIIRFLQRSFGVERDLRGVTPPCVQLPNNPCP